MAETLDRFVIIRIKESTRQRLKVKAARYKLKLWEVAEAVSKTEGGLIRGGGLPN